MAFLTTTITSCFPTTNNQLRTSSNPRNQSTLQDGRVTVQEVSGRHGQSFQFKQGLLGVTIVKEKGIWQGNALSQRSQGSEHDPGVAKSQDTQKIMTHNAAFQNDDLDAFNSVCDEALGARAVLMANVSSYNSDVISEIPISYTNQDNSILDNCVQEMYYSEQPAFDPASDIEITSDRNIISYDQYLKETESAAVQDTTST
ncbi:hypothetical protein Tco_1418319 [Tanacetum coccineum]